MNQTLKVSFAIGRHVKRNGFASRDEGQWDKPLGSRMMVVNALRGCGKLEETPFVCLELLWQKKAISSSPTFQATLNS